MRAAAFEYHSPASIDEALVLLLQLGDGAKILAGGLSLVPAMLARLSRPVHLVDINRLARAERPQLTAARLKVPPLMRHIDFEALPFEGPLAELLIHVSREIAQLPIRLRGTFCGSLAHADPASHWSLVTVALDGEILASSALRGMRTIPAGGFFESVMATVLAEDEMITEVQIPLLPPTARFGFDSVVRRAGTFPLASALAIVEPDGPAAGKVRLALGGLEVAPRRLRPVEAMLEGEVATPALLRECAASAARAVDPIASDAADTRYRRDLAAAVTLRALHQATLA